MGGALTAEDITNVIKIAFDCRPGAIAMSLALREPKYQETAAYCHFGREAITKEGIKFFEWENKGSEAVQGDDFSSGHCCIDSEQLPYKMGGLSVEFRCVVL